MNILHAQRVLAHLEKTEPLAIGARTRHDVELRVRELRQRYEPAPCDLREITQLEEFLKSVAR
jgi:hypothetical protein